MREYVSLTFFHDDLAWQREALLRWLLLGEYGLISSDTLHDIDGGWKQEALLCWLLFKDYGHCTWYNDDVMGLQDALLWWLLLRKYGH